MLRCAGRAKDTIVLSNGENVEPQPIEDALCCSPYIKFAGARRRVARGVHGVSAEGMAWWHRSERMGGLQPPAAVVAAATRELFCCGMARPAAAPGHISTSRHAPTPSPPRPPPCLQY